MKSRRYCCVAVAASPAVLGTTLAGCGCYEASAPDDVRFSFTGAWAPGLWQIEASALEKGQVSDAMCVVTLPWTQDDVVSCSAGAILEFDDEGGVATFTATLFTPPVFGFRIYHDGESVLERTFEPEYDITQGTPGECGKTTRAEIDLQAPE